MNLAKSFLYKINRIALTILLFLIVSGCNSQDNALQDVEYRINSSSYIKKVDLEKNSFDALCVPTQMTKLDGNYYIVDCYHSQILTSEEATKPVQEWTVMSSDIFMGHSISGDGIIYLCDDTENNRVLTYIRDNNNFYLNQVFENVGIRPHFTCYNPANKYFYVLSSLTGEFYLFKRIANKAEVTLDKVIQIPELNNVYIRSFTFIDNLIYLPAGDGYIYKIDPESFEILDTYPLPDELAGPAQIYRINDYYYLTVSTDININPEFANFVRAKSLDDFISGNYEEIKHLFTASGTPYVISAIDDTYYLAWHSDDGSECMWSFNVDSNNNINQIHKVFN